MTKILLKCGAAAWLALCCGGAMAAAPAQTHSGIPVDLQVPVAPSAASVEGRAHLFYELHISNFSGTPFTLSKLEVLGDEAAAPLLARSGDDLRAIVLHVGGGDDPDSGTNIGAGARIVLFLDVPLAGNAKVPRRLRHHLQFSLQKPDGETVTKDLDGAPVDVRATALKPLQAPLKGAGWIATDLLNNAPDSHWRTLLAVDGKVRAAQRYAIDWVRVGADGRLFRDDVKENRNWHAYGAPVLAVADAVVADVRDGQPENTPTEDRAAPVTLDTIAGNYVMLNLGDGRYALYAHLQPGSLRVKAGERVRAGQVLAALGNSGNSDAPHLHFHVVDANSPLGAEGVPYVFERYALRAHIAPDKLAGETIFSGEPLWTPDDHAGTPRSRELPGNDALLDFP